MKEIVTVEEVFVHEDGYCIKAKEGNVFFLSKENAGEIVPKVGDVITLHTYCGSSIRGMDINSVSLYYKTDEELEEIRKTSALRVLKLKEEAFKKNEPTLNKIFALLPKLLQHRIEMFRIFSPNFRVKDEMYELSAVFLASKIYRHCSSAKTIDEFDEKVSNFDVSKYINHHWFFSQAEISSNQVAFAGAFATAIFRDHAENGIDVNNPSPVDIYKSYCMRIPDALSPLRDALCWPREEFISEYIQKIA